MPPPPRRRRRCCHPQGPRRNRAARLALCVGARVRCSAQHAVPYASPPPLLSRSRSPVYVRRGVRVNNMKRRWEQRVDHVVLLVLQSMVTCVECGCERFVANPFKKGKCATCFHVHEGEGGGGGAATPAPAPPPAVPRRPPPQVAPPVAPAATPSAGAPRRSSIVVPARPSVGGSQGVVRPPGPGRVRGGCAWLTPCVALYQLLGPPRARLGPPHHVSQYAFGVLFGR